MLGSGDSALSAELASDEDRFQELCTVLFFLDVRGPPEEELAGPVYKWCSSVVADPSFRAGH